MQTLIVTTTLFLLTHSGGVGAQEATPPGSSDMPGEIEESDTSTPDVPATVNVESVTDDDDIEVRLERILTATGWFDSPRVQVDHGVAFLSGGADQVEHSEWAARLAGNTEDVVAVVNRLRVAESPLWNIGPAFVVLRQLVRDAIQSLPLLAVGCGILLLTWLAVKMTVWIADATLLKHIETNLLREVTRKTLAVPVILIGIYLVLTVSGLSRLAMTVIGGTGLFGLVLGVAFRDIMENFLASILISIQNPFQYGDLIEVQGFLGYVQRVNTRGTLLITSDGNHVQIPNSSIYKNVVTNYTSNPNVRLDFTVGVGFDSAVSEAQEIAMQVLSDHPAVLDDPEPMVLVEELGSSTVNLRVYLWVDTHRLSGLKVRSSVIRQVMRKLEAAGISMPDDAREVVFPDQVPVRMLKQDSADSRPDTSAGPVDLPIL
ncbi:MAG: mechanosensitive ion channel family protein [Planctomycetaceae bacterium]